MSRTHFEAIAWALAHEETTTPQVIRAMADVCAAANGSFNRERFYVAAGYYSHAMPKVSA